jgi:hypothetical protein
MITGILRRRLLALFGCPIACAAHQEITVQFRILGGAGAIARPCPCLVGFRNQDPADAGARSCSTAWSSFLHPTAADQRRSSRTAAGAQHGLRCTLPPPSKGHGRDCQKEHNTAEQLPPPCLYLFGAVACCFVQRARAKMATPWLAEARPLEDVGRWAHA